MAHRVELILAHTGRTGLLAAKVGVPVRDIPTLHNASNGLNRIKFDALHQRASIATSFSNRPDGTDTVGAVGLAHFGAFGLIAST